MATVLERVSTLIVDKLGVDAESIKPEATFAEDLNADSLPVPGPETSTLKVLIPNSNALLPTS